jgi:peptidyl serine alpha-galactosyltransferase
VYVHTVFSTDGSLYQRWQADLLAYSYKKVNQPGTLTRLYSASSSPPEFDGRTFQTAPYSPHPTTKDHYPPYNRIGALAEWLALSSPADETLLIVDPDFVFLTAYDEPVERGRPAAQPIGYMDPTIASNAKVLRRHGYNAESVQAIGVPLLIHPEDLRAVLPLWMEKTEAIRNDPMSRELVGWIADMWGYAFAAVQLGLRHELRDLALWQRDDQADLPFIHYCYESAQGEWEWSKRTYRPWERVPEPPSDTPQATVALVSLLNELAERQEHEVLGDGR